MPWQQQVADVAGEIDPATGRLAYREIGLTVPRQSGKTTLILAFAVHRALATKHFGPRQVMTYTAQTRKDARKKWEEDFVGDLEASREMAGRFAVVRGVGNEHIRFANRSRLGIDANTEKSGHGGTLDVGFVDEAFAHSDNRLEQAFKPAMITRQQPQLWVVSTAGWLGESEYLAGKIEKGRAATEADPGRGLAYFEWSAEADADPDDRDVWRACMPALGHTIDEDAIDADRLTMEESEFRRAYLNQWVRKGKLEPPIFVPGLWTNLQDPHSAPGSPLGFAIDSAPDRSSTTFLVAGPRDDGLLHVEVIANRDGAAWVVPLAAEVLRRQQARGVVVDPGGPAGALIADLEAEGVKVIKPTSRDVTQATGAFYDAVNAAKIRYRGVASDADGVTRRDEALTAAIAGARKQAISGGETWKWARRHPDIDLSPLVAATLASWGVATAPEPSVDGWVVSL